MNADMCGQVRRQQERLWAFRTLECLFAGMRSHVTVQMSGLRVRFETMRALERPFPGVNSTVRQEVPGLRCVMKRIEENINEFDVGNQCTTYVEKDQENDNLPNDLGHFVQWKDLSPVWTRVCIDKCAAEVKGFSQVLHRNGFSGSFPCMYSTVFTRAPQLS